MGYAAGVSLVFLDLVSATLTFDNVWPFGQETFLESTMESGPLAVDTPMSSRSSLKVRTGMYMLGVRTPMLSTGSSQQVAFGLFLEGGYAAIHGVNSIADCSNCHSASLPLGNGAVMRAGIAVTQIFRRPRRVDFSPGLALSYLQFFGSAGLTREVRLSLTLAVG